MGIAHTVFLDACAIIYWVEGCDPWYGIFQQQLKRLQQAHGTVRIAISDLSRLECLVKPLRDKNPDIVSLYETFFHHPDLIIQKLIPSVIEQALKIRVEHGLKTPDAIQAACALEVGQPISFMTADRKFLDVDGLDVALIGTEPL